MFGGGTVLFMLGGGIDPGGWIFGGAFY